MLARASPVHPDLCASSPSLPQSQFSMLWFSVLFQECRIHHAGINLAAPIGSRAANNRDRREFLAAIISSEEVANAGFDSTPTHWQKSPLLSLLKSCGNKWYSPRVAALPLCSHARAMKARRSPWGSLSLRRPQCAPRRRRISRCSLWK